MLRKILNRLGAFLNVPRHQMIKNRLGNGIEGKPLDKHTRKQMTGDQLSQQSKSSKARRKF